MAFPSNSEMTFEEHVTRAMLLGMKYVKSGNYYVDEERGKSLMECPRIDADTFEPIDWAEAKRRFGHK